MRYQCDCSKVTALLCFTDFWNRYKYTFLKSSGMYPDLYILLIKLVIISIPFSPILCNSSAEMLSLLQSFPFGRSLITATISSLLIVYTSFTKSSISASPLFSSLYKSSTYSAHLSITSSFSNKLFPCLLLIVCNILFPFGLSSLISDTVIDYVLYLAFQFPCTYPHSIYLWLHDIAFVPHVSASYTFLPLSCFCIFFLLPSYSISLSSSNSASLASVLSRKSPPQPSQYHLSTSSKFRLFPSHHRSSPPVVFCPIAFYKRL